MGGSGSGRPCGSASYGLTNDSLCLDIRTIKREGCLIPGHSYSWFWKWRHSEKKNTINFSVYEDRLELNYKSRKPGEEWQSLKYPVLFSKSQCHLGGERMWFLCPGKGCSKRVAILYGGTYYLCRKCAGLVYASQRETDLDRSTRRIDKLRERLKWSPGFLNGSEWKPKGMHWATYWRLNTEYERLTQQVFLQVPSIAPFQL